MSTLAFIVSMMFLLGWNTEKLEIPSIKQEVKPEEATIGDRIHFRVMVYSDTSKRVIPPENRQGLGRFVVKNRNIRTNTRKNLKVTTIDYELVSYDVGKDTIPPLSIKIVKGKDEEEIKTEPVSVLIKSVAPDITGEEDIKGLKPQMGIKLSYWYYVAGFLLFAFVLGAIYLYLRRKRIREIMEEIERVPPWEKAFVELEKISGEGIKTHLQIKKFYTELSYILRDYFGSLYDFPALEYTTGEILGKLKKIKDYSPHMGTTADFLRRSDLVKFAKYIPHPFKPDEEISTVRMFVDMTKKEEKEEEEKDV
jgi:hypothetical protein